MITRSSMDTLSEAIKKFRQGRTNILTVIRTAHTLTTHIAIWSEEGFADVLLASRELAADHRKGLDIFYGPKKES